MQEFWIYIFVDGDYVKCAKLSISESGFELQYLAEYLNSKSFIAIDPQNIGPYSRGFNSEELFGAIRDSAPDYWGLELLNRKFQVTELNEIEYVFANNLEHVGALAYSPVKYDVPMKLEKGGWVNHKNRKIDIEQIIEQTEFMIKDMDGERLKELFEYGPTLGGGKPKVSLTIDDKLYLAKYGTSLDSTPEQKIEYATMKMATDLGLNVPTIMLSKHLDRDVYMIERFDRFYSNGELHKLHFISALSLCDWHEFGMRDWSYPVLCDYIQKTGKLKEEITEDLRELFRRVAYNIAVNNNDDHPRNHGLLNIDGRWRLSPLYDVVPKAIKGETFTMAMSIGIYEREASKRNLLSSAKYFNISDADAVQLIDEINGFVQKNWKQYFKDAGIKDSIITQFENAMRIK
jgi:serine/threonine-protein kinase HipA